MTIYLDNDYKCHLDNASGRREIETEVFDGLCKTYIEGYHYVPHGETWTRSDGAVITGDTMFPFVDWEELKYAQNGYGDRDEEVADLIDTIEDLCNELIGE